MNSPTTRVAIVGSGPSGFYAAGALLAVDGLAVDMFDRLPTPFGLVRAGVAPDHPKIKSVTRIFDRSAAHERFRFIGNVRVGFDLATEELRRCYDAVIYAYGAGRGKLAGVPGQELPGNFAAADIVGWYNGHPDRADLTPCLDTERAVVIGNGNVALDVARMLALPAETLAATDIADHALNALRRSHLREVVVLGRRGADVAAFTLPEVLELGELPGVDIVVDGAQLPPRDSDLPESVQEKLEVLRRFSERQSRNSHRRVVLRFDTTPEAIVGDRRATAIRTRNTAHENPSASAEWLPAGLIVHAVGYTGSPLPGLPFDSERGIVPNLRGRITANGVPMPGQYVTGWIKRGPTGIIGTNRVCATETADSVLADLRAGLLPARPADDRCDVVEMLGRRGVDIVTFDGWKLIDECERGRGEGAGRPRVKLVELAQLVAVGTDTHRLR